MRPACRFEDLQLYAYGFLEGPERALVESHLIDCPDCRREVDELVAERHLVAFELSLEPGVAEADPEPVPSRRRLRIAAPIAVAAAAILLVVAALFTVLDGSDPVVIERNWTVLPDGSRIDPEEGATIARGREPRSLRLDGGALLIDVESAEEPFVIATPHGEVRIGAGRIEVKVGSGGTSVDVLAGEARFVPNRESDDGPPPRPFPDNWHLALEGDPELLEAIWQLVAENEDLRKQLEARRDETANPVLPDDPERAVREFDWAAVTRLLAEIAPGLRPGRIPRDPDVLRRYLESLSNLGALANVLEIERSIAALAKDPRTGPKLLVAALSQAWPDAPAEDLARAEEEVTRMLTDHAAREDTAETPAEVAAAGAELRTALTKTVEDFEKRQGPASTASPVEVERDGAQDFRPDDEPPPAGDPGTPSVTSNAERVLTTAGFPATNDRVLRGSESRVADRLVTDWRTDFRLTARHETELGRIAWDWVADYREVLRRSEPTVVAALDARLAGKASDGRVKESEVLALRAKLLETQARAEKRVFDLVKGAGLTVPAGYASTPTFFLLNH